MRLDSIQVSILSPSARPLGSVASNWNPIPSYGLESPGFGQTHIRLLFTHITNLTTSHSIPITSPLHPDIGISENVVALGKSFGKPSFEQCSLNLFRPFILVVQYEIQLHCL